MSEVQHWQIDDISIIEDKNFLTDKQKDFINNVVTSKNTDAFPFYVRSKSADNGSGYMTGLFHRVIEPEFNFNNKLTQRSEFYDEFEDILETFCNKNDIEYRMLIRCAVNLVYYDGYAEGDLHTDHDCDHKNLIVYLNDPLDTNSTTNIFEDNESMIHSCKPERYKALYFARNNNTPVKHGMTNPRTGHRYTLIYTFI